MRTGIGDAERNAPKNLFNALSVEFCVLSVPAEVFSPPETVEYGRAADVLERRNFGFFENVPP